MKCIFLTLLLTIFASKIGDAQHNKCLAPSNQVCRWIKVPRYVYDPQTGTCKRQMVCWFTGFPNKRRCEENCKDIINGGTCASVQCAAGTVCTIENGAVRCVPSSSGTKPSRCLLPAEPGVCRAYTPSYFYNVETGKCEKFIYGGCGGNDNRFLTQQRCETVCMKDESDGQPTVTCANVRCAAGTVCTIENGAVRCVPNSSGTKPEKCLLPVDSGPCKAYMPSYFYNSATDSCELFIYGGCQGNANRFSSQKLCDSVCTENRAKILDALGNGQQPSVTCASVRCPAGTVCTVINGVVHCAPSSAVGNKPEKCFLPAAPGPCEAYMPSYHYNSQTGRCVQFIYGGCQGNDNRFATQKWCERVCVHNQKCIVRTPPRPGCRFSHVRTGEDGCLVYGDLICDSIGQPSSCPKLPPGTVGICVERCSRDGDCNQGEKCCSNGCGHVCMRAV